MAQAGSPFKGKDNTDTQHKKKKGSEFSNSSKPSGSSYSDKNNYSNNSGNNERQAQDAKRKVNMIKQLLIKDIEATIDRRLNYIFSVKGVNLIKYIKGFI